jgi:hypothetical protein
VIVGSIIKQLLIGALILWVLNNSKTIGADIGNINSQMIKSTVQPITNAWLEITVLGAGITFLLWFASTQVNKHEGLPLQPLAAPSLQLAPQPTFGTTGGLSVQGPGFATTSGYAAGQQAAAAPAAGAARQATFARRARRPAATAARAA